MYGRCAVGGTLDLEPAALVERFLNRVAGKTSNQRISYAELDGEINSVALGFSTFQAQLHDQVAVSLGNNVEYVVVRLTRPALTDWSDRSTSQIVYA